MNSSSVYSIGDSLYKRATQFYNDYISREKQTVQEMLKEINHGEIIFSKNNVCIHLNEPHLADIATSPGACNQPHKNCLPGYFSIKLIKCEQPENRTADAADDTQKLANLIKPTVDAEKKVAETSFIIEEQFDIEKVVNKESSGKREEEDLNIKNDLKNAPNRTSSAYLKQQTEPKIVNSSPPEQQPTSSHPFYSMMITWIPNLIFEEKPNKLTRNLSLKSTKSLNKSFNQTSKKRHKSLPNLNEIMSHNLCDSLINSRASKSDSHLNLISKSFHTFRSGEEMADEESLIFTIDIKKVKSLKLFFGSQMNREDETCECKDGQLVIGNDTLQYKIFHFHNGGISKLEQFLENWNFVFFKQKNLNSGFLSFFENLYEESSLFGDTNDSLLDFYKNKFLQLKTQKQLEQEYNNNEISCIQLYSINLPALNYLDLQNEYSTYKPLAINNIEDYNQYFSPDGLLTYDYDKLKLRAFFAGCAPASRKYFWPYLLNRFSPNLTTSEKNEIKKHGEFLYKNIDMKRRNMKPDDKFYRKFIQYRSTILEDVPRTDRNNKALQDKSKLKQMQRLLENYTLYSTRIGYTQGFSDLLVPLVIYLDETESEIFFNFVCLLEKKNLVCLPNDQSIDECMAKIRELLRILDVKFYNYFKQLGEQSFQLLFTHRWMLLCFRREFPENSALRIWESVFSEFQYQFQLFICIAIIQIYGCDLIEKQLNSDDILFFFSNLSHKMSAELVMKKAQSNLFQFRSLNKVPCTLRSLCNYSKSKPNSPSNWTTQLQPFFECVSSTDNPDTILLCTCDKK